MRKESPSFRPAQRMSGLVPQLFAELNRHKQTAIDAGIPVIDLGVADPDLPIPAHVLDVLQRESRDHRNHRYPDTRGLPEFRQAVAEWYRARHDVTLDPETEVLALLGAKEGLIHVSLAFLDPGQVALVPNPAYPAYCVGTLLAGGEAYPLPLRSNRNFLPDLSAVPADMLRRARLLFLNFPNNPTTACAPREFLAEVVAFAARHGLLVCHDFVYSEIWFGCKAPLSILAVDGAQEVCIEFLSFSKTYSMAGLRIGAVVGNYEALATFAALKEHIDSGVFNALQLAAVAALRSPQQTTDSMRSTYQARREIVVEAFRRKGVPFTDSMATPFVWAPVPIALDSMTWAIRLLQETGVVIAPGVGFGFGGEGYYRMSLTAESDQIQEAVRRIISLSS